VTVWVLLLLAVLAGAFLAVVSRDLMVSVVSLGFMSAALAGAYFHMGLSYAGAFELSAGAGLTTVMFVSILSIMRETRVSPERRTRMNWTRLLGISVTLALALILGFSLGESIPSFVPSHFQSDVGFTLWRLRVPDILVLGLLVFSGALGISAMFHREGGRAHG